MFEITYIRRYCKSDLFCTRPACKTNFVIVCSWLPNCNQILNEKDLELAAAGEAEAVISRFYFTLYVQFNEDDIIYKDERQIVTIKSNVGCNWELEQN